MTTPISETQETAEYLTFKDWLNHMNLILPAELQIVDYVGEIHFEGRVKYIQDQLLELPPK